MTDRLAYAGILLCLAFVLLVESWPVIRVGLQNRVGLQDSGQVERGGRLLVTEASAVDTDGTFYLRPRAVAGEKASTIETVGLSSASLEAGPVGVSTGTLLPPATATYLQDVERSSVSDRGKSDRRVAPPMAGIATWVHPSLHGNVQADGRVYSRWNVRYAASNDYELGTMLELRHDGRAIEVEVQDRGLLGENHLDLSEQGFLSLVGSLDPGVIRLDVRVLGQGGHAVADATWRQPIFGQPWGLSLNQVLEDKP